MMPWKKIKDIFSPAQGAPRAQPAKLSKSENRVAKRRSQRLVQGYIISDRMVTSKQCSIRDVSSTGARIDLLNGDLRPEIVSNTITLYITAENREIDCQVVWRKAMSLGLRFTGGYREPTKQYGRA